MQRLELAGQVDGGVEAADLDVQILVIRRLLDDFDCRAGDLRDGDVVDLEGVGELADADVRDECLIEESLLHGDGREAVDDVLEASHVGYDAQRAGSRCDRAILYIG